MLSRARKKLRISRKSSMRASWDFTTFVNLNKTVPNRRIQCSQSLLKSLINRWLQVVPSWQLQLTIMPTVLGVGDGDKSILGERLCSTCHRNNTATSHGVNQADVHTRPFCEASRSCFSSESLWEQLQWYRYDVSFLSSSPVSHSIQIFTTGSS